MDAKEIYELLTLYGNEGVPKLREKKIDWKSIPPERVLRILETYDELAD